MRTNCAHLLLAVDHVDERLRAGDVVDGRDHPLLDDEVLVDHLKANKKLV